MTYIKVGEQFEVRPDKIKSHKFMDRIMTIKRVENPESNDGFIYFDTDKGVGNRKKKYNHSARVWWFNEWCRKIPNQFIIRGIKKMEKKDIKVISRKQNFYSDDMESIEKKENDWGDLKVLHDLTEADTEEETLQKGVVICWNEKEKIFEVLDYRF